MQEWVHCIGKTDMFTRSVNEKKSDKKKLGEVLLIHATKKTSRHIKREMAIFFFWRFSCFSCVALGKQESSSFFERDSGGIDVWIK